MNLPVFNVLTKKKYSLLLVSTVFILSSYDLSMPLKQVKSSQIKQIRHTKKGHHPPGFSFNQHQQNLFNTYIQRIQDFPNFTSDEQSPIQIEWKYNRTSSELTNLIKTNHLKEIAGDGTEIDLFLNLMEWVHRATQSEEKIGNPDTLNAVAILNYVKTQNRALNCRMKSIVLNEILTGLGYYSRRISCKPSQFDGDSHSIVTVYSMTLNKWICLDPTFNTFFHDHLGNILSYIEIRNTYRSGVIPRFRSININPKGPLMLSGIEFQNYDQWYGVYMAKNCFKVSCPQISKFGYESSESPRRVYLVPFGYSLENQEKTNSLFTTNSNSFFQKPY